MRILQVLHNHKYGGAEQHLLQLCLGLRACGHEVACAVPRSAWIGQRLAELDFEIHDFDFRGHYDLPALYRLTRLLRRHRYDLVHSHLVRAAYYGRIAARLAATPLVCTVHDVTTWKRYPRTARIIAVSEAVRRHLVSRGFDGSRIEVVFPGAKDCDLGTATTARRAATRSALGLREDTLAIFLIGRVAEVKGHDVALRAARRLHEEPGNRAALFFAGQETAWGAALHSADSDNLACWLGRRDDIPDLLAAADICIQPSHNEGLPLALMEASSAAKAMIASRVGGVPEVIEDGVSGLLIADNADEALAAAILELAKDSGRRAALGAAARQRFVDSFSVERMVERTIAVYQSFPGHQRGQIG